MREIKFRAWNKKAQRYIEPNYLAISPANSRFSEWCISGDGYTIRADTTEYIIEQFTGEYDIEGEEIYIGDEVEIAHDGFMSQIPAGFTGIVKFMEGGFYVDNAELELMFPVWQEIGQWEITGNIHETKP